MTISYGTIFSRVRGRINDPKELSLNEEDLTEIYVERLHNTFGNPRVRRIFSVGVNFFFSFFSVTISVCAVSTFFF